MHVRTAIWILRSSFPTASSSALAVKRIVAALGPHTPGMDLHTYRFHSTWQVDAAPGDVYEALRIVGDYPAWWPQVCRADWVGDGTYDLVVRSLLPYNLRFRSTRSREDPTGRVLEAALSGDLEGFSRWTVTASGGGTLLVFDEEVVARKALLRRLAVVARPALVANHAVMMRTGCRGLRAHLAGRRSGGFHRHPRNLQGVRCGRAA